MTYQYFVAPGQSFVAGNIYQGRQCVSVEFSRRDEKESRVEIVFSSLHSIDALATVLRSLRAVLSREIEGQDVPGSDQFRPVELIKELKND